MRRAYENWNAGSEARGIIRQADAICRQYAAKGYDLTLRQLYYQFVARDLIPEQRRVVQQARRDHQPGTDGR